VGFVVNNNVTGVAFFRILWFPLQLIPLTALHSSSGAATIGQIVADVASGLSLILTKETKKSFTQFHAYLQMLPVRTAVLVSNKESSFDAMNVK
jgi:hypothetical protein